MPKIKRESLKILMETIPEGYFIHDINGRILDANSAFCKLLGLPPNDLKGIEVGRFTSFNESIENKRMWCEAVPGMALTFRRQAIRADGATFPVEVSITCQEIDNEKLFLGLVRDISEREAVLLEKDRKVTDLENLVTERTNELTIAHDRIAVAAKIGGLGVWDYNFADNRLFCDDRWHQIMGLDQSRPAKTPTDFYHAIHPDDLLRVTEIERRAAELVTEVADYRITFRVIHPSGEVRWVQSTANLLTDEEGSVTHVIGFLIDITDDYLDRKKMHALSFEDALTGVSNRRAFDTALTDQIQCAHLTGEALSLALFDIDYFKRYNDALGHPAGDEALVAIAQVLLRNTRRSTDCVARYGGEEFAIILPGVSDPKHIIENIFCDLENTAVIHPDSPVSTWITMSCGCVVMQNMAEAEPKNMIKTADDALYRAKKAGRNTSEIITLP